MNHRDFPRIRDTIALASMRERLPVLHTRADEAWQAYQIELVDVNKNNKGKWTDSLREVAMEWQRVEADIANTLRAIPVVEARLAAIVEPPTQVTLLNSLMGAFGYKKASGE